MMTLNDPYFAGWTGGIETSHVIEAKRVRRGQGRGEATQRALPGWLEAVLLVSLPVGLLVGLRAIANGLALERQQRHGVSSAASETYKSSRTAEAGIG